MKKKYTPYLLLIPQIILLVIFMIGLINGITQSFGVIPTFGLREPTLKYYQEVLSSSQMKSSILFSLYISFTSSIFAVIIGTLICAVIVMNKKTKWFYEKLIEIPVVVPHIVVAIFILNIFSKSGLLARILYYLGIISSQDQFINLVYDKYGIGIILAYLWKEVPFIIYFVLSIMSNINDSLGEAAINLGASKYETFKRVTLPLCKNTILSGFLIIFVFITPLLVTGGNTRFIKNGLCPDPNHSPLGSEKPSGFSLLESLGAIKCCQFLILKAWSLSGTIDSLKKL